MSLSEQIEKEYIQAYKAGDSVRLAVLRLLKTAAKNRLVEFKRPGRRTFRRGNAGCDYQGG